MSERVVLGIDPGTGRMGWAIVSRSSVVSRQSPVASGRSSVVGGWLNGPQTTNHRPQTNLVSCGLIETPPKTPVSKRLKVIYKEITKIIKKYQPTELAIEELFFVKNVKTAISVAQARGVVMLACELAKIPIFEYKPNEIKLAISGFGHADKSQMRKMLKLHLKGCRIKQDDTVDAISVALTHLQINKK
jgi:crossover junction endodeoxyribonuclease RuvC